ncbi:MAG: sulfite exporter TauE/SafE family protein, partial [Burkholderiaceae bacterium]|nr:sulfite exporter TauE/SafE family protein [Burkholderiaceae bacterium]
AATLYKVLAFKQHENAADLALRRAHPERATQPRHWSLPILMGAVIGTLVTLTSVGAGAIGVTVLLLVYPLLPLPRIIGADIAYAVPLTLVAGLGHATLGSVDWSLLGLLLTGSLPGIWLGSRLISRTPERLIRTLLCGLLAWAGTKLVMI